MNVPVSPKAGFGSQARAVSDGARKQRILVVDDVADNRDILSRRLSRRGYDIIEACNGTEALQRIAEEDIDIVLLDIMMPDILGTEVVREVRKTRSPGELPIIMVSAKSQSEDVAESLSLGANDYVIKPVDFTITLARIESHLKHREATISEKQSRAEAESAAAELRSMVEEKLAALDQTNQHLLIEAANRKRSEDQLQYLAFHDALTDLSNRFALLDKLEEALGDEEMLKRDVIAIFIDLDRFKCINDVHGHHVGDLVLCEVARKLEAAMPENAICLARLGGDEFAAAFPADNNPDIGMEVGKKIVETLSEPFFVNGLQIQIGASCGLAKTSLCGSKPGLLIKAADLAMYRAKKEGRGTVVVFDPSILEEQRNRSFLEVSMAGALSRDEFEVHYQPLIDAETGQISCFEALLRWHHPERGTISPADFIPVAEETGYIVPIGAWVLQQSCEALRSWPENIRVAVNLSPVQFRQPDLINTIRDALETSCVKPERLAVEITESCLLDAESTTVEVLTEMRDLGIMVAIDDFGTGYSSMSYLKQFAFDKLKIDRRFICDADSDPRSAAIVDAIIGLSGKMGSSTTVEGVETEAQFNFAVSRGCDELQGFMFSAPMPADRVMDFVKSYKAPPISRF